jgi:integrase
MTANLPVSVRNVGLPASAVEITERAEAYRRQSQSENTQLAYASDWRTFWDWCAHHGAQAMPATASTVAAFLVDTAGAVSVATQRRRLAAIKDMQRRAGHHLDLSTGPFQDIWGGIRRAHGRAAVKKAPMVTAVLRQALEVLPPGLSGARDRALLLIGFAGALRRTELASVEVAERPDANWIEDGRDGLTLHLARSKGDQEGEGQVVGIPFGSNPSTCPVRAWRAWLEVSQITEGPAFRSINRHGQLGEDPLCDHSVALVIKRAIVAGEMVGGARKRPRQLRKSLPGTR